jgi:hypothetical protein
VRLQRILLTLAVATAVSLSSACAQESDSTAGAATTTSAAAPSPTVDLKANTEAVCKAVMAAYDAEKAELANVLGELISAGVEEDKTAIAAAEAKGQALMGRLTKAVSAETAKAVDPAAKAAFDSFMTTFAKSLTIKGLDDAAVEAEMDKASAEVEKYCPALTK